MIELIKNKMKKYYSLLLAFLFIISTSFIYHTGNKGAKNPNISAISKKKNKYLDGMIFIPMGTFTTPSNNGYNATEKDSTLLLSYIKKQISVQAFYLSKNEVTNSEYREFVRWAKNKMAHDILVKQDSKYQNKKGEYNQDIPIDWENEQLQKALFSNQSEFNSKSFKVELLKYTVVIDGKSEQVDVFPDTLIWMAKNRYNKPLTDNYFWHPAYDYYPVVGVTWKQAQAYCQWRTDRLNEEVLIAAKVLDSYSDNFSTTTFLKDSKNKEYQHLLYPSFRLPSESEWEFAAMGAQNQDSKYVYPWKSSRLFNKKGKYYANFGPITDINAVRIKNYIDDDGFHTIIVSNYEPNGLGLYDMAGNVAEWQNDKYSIELETKQAIEVESVNGKDQAAISHAAKQHDAKIAKAQHPARVVKGGSWADGPIYLQISTRTIMNENSSSMRVGFRIAMDYSKK